MKPLTPLELDALEARLQHPIPAPYRELLTHTGAGEHGDVQVYHPLEIEEAYQYHFEEPEELFNSYLPFGCNQRSQEIWLIRVTDGRAAAIWHETHPESYPDERWLDWAQWLADHGRGLPA